MTHARPSRCLLRFFRRPRCGGLRRRLTALRRDCRATIAIEFAFALPIFCGMTFALYEVTQGIICYMKVYDVANSVADLIGQTSIAAGGVGDSDLDNYYIAGQMIMTPSAGANLGLAIASVRYDVNGQNPLQVWQKTRGGGTAMANAIAFVNGLGTAHGSTIVVQASYSYTSLLNYFITTPIMITAQVAAQPRNLLPTAYCYGVPYLPVASAQNC